MQIAGLAITARVYVPDNYVGMPVFGKMYYNLKVIHLLLAIIINKRKSEVVIWQYSSKYLLRSQ